MRQRIVDMALKSFCAHGFKGATTRQIASAAGVHLPAIRYYFGNKEGLYRACAEEVIAYYRRQVDRAANDADTAPDTASEPKAARARLKAFVRALASFPADRESLAPFVYREINDPGPAFEVLRRALWDPGITYIARLISELLGEETAGVSARVQAVLLISSLVAFRAGQRLSVKLVGWTAMGEAELEMVLAIVDAQIDAIGRA